jgi:hypothetical protein
MAIRNVVLLSGTAPGRTSLPRFTIEGTRRDGTHTTLLGWMTFSEAERALEAIREAHIFADVRIVSYSAESFQCN